MQNGSKRGKRVIKKTMQALVYEGPRLMNMRQVSAPQYGENDVLIKVSYAGICGSELSGYHGNNSLRLPPLIMGHEFSGVIVDKGSNAGKHQIGDRVTANPLAACLNCVECRSGFAQLCRERKLLGAHLPGAYAEYVSVPADQVYKLPDQLSLQRAAMKEPLACAVHIARLAELTAGDTLLIAGAGPIGLLTLLVAQHYGIQKVVVQEIHPARLNMVSILGGIAVSGEQELAEVTPDRGFAACVDAVGLDVTRQLCVNKVRPGGKVVFSGLHSADSLLPVNDIIRNEVTLKGAFAYAPDDFIKALEWADDYGEKRLEPWVQEAPLEEGQACFEKLSHEPAEIAKILLHVE